MIFTMKMSDYSIKKTEVQWRLTFNVKNYTEPITINFQSENIEDAIAEYRRMVEAGVKLEFDYGTVDFKDAELIKCELMKINYSKLR